VDVAMVINEVVDLAKKGNCECLVFKVDFEKTYDSVDFFFFGVYDKEGGFVWKVGEMDGGVCVWGYYVHTC